MGKKWADKEHAAESQFFNKRDAELLQQLASKLHSHTTQPTDGVQAKHRAAILAVFEKHAVTPVDALVDDVRILFYSPPTLLFYPPFYLLRARVY